MRMNKRMRFIKAALMTLVISIVFISATACNWRGDDWFGERGVDGSGRVVEEIRNVGTFNRVELHGAGRLYIDFGSVPSLRIVAEDNILPIIETRVEGDTLVVESDRSYNTEIGINIYINMTQVREFSLRGAWKVIGQAQFNADRLDLELTGAGQLDLDVDAKRIYSSISGAGDINLKGNADLHELHISGVGSLDAYDLIVKDYIISISGAGSCHIFAGNSLDAHISGAGSIYYMGDPADVTSSITGTGKLVKK